MIIVTHYWTFLAPSPLSIRQNAPERAGGEVENQKCPVVADY